MFCAGEYKGKTVVFEFSDIGGDTQAILRAVIVPGPDAIRYARLFAGAEMLLEAAQDALQSLRDLGATDTDLLEEAIHRASEGV